MFQIVLELFTPTLSWSGGGLPNLGKIRKNLENSKFGFGGVFQLLDRGRHTLPKKNPVFFQMFSDFFGLPTPGRGGGLVDLVDLDLVHPPLVAQGSGESRFTQQL